MIRAVLWGKHSKTVKARLVGYFHWRVKVKWSYMDPQLQVFCFGKAIRSILKMWIMEIHEMDVISIKKAMTKGWKQTVPDWQRTTKMGSCRNSFVFMCGGSEKSRFDLNGSAKCRFKIFLNFSYEEQVTSFFFWFCQVVEEYAMFQNNYSGILISRTTMFFEPLNNKSRLPLLFQTL